MIEALLVIIAIGVLLCIEPVRKLLGWGISLSVSGAALLLIIWGGCLGIASLKQLSIIAFYFIVLGFISRGIIWSFNWLEQKIRRLGNYSAGDKQLPWYKPAPNVVIIIIVPVIVMLLFYFCLYRAHFFELSP